MNQLNNLLGNKKVYTILSFFITNPSVELSQTELIKKIKISKATAVKWLNLLVKEHMLVLKKIGTTNLYSLNNDSIIIKHLKLLSSLFRIRPLGNILNDCELYLFGSCSRGEDTEKSDMDILIISDLKRDKIIAKIENFSKKIGKRINFSVFSNLDWAMMQQKDKAFYERVEKDKLRIE